MPRRPAHVSSLLALLLLLSHHPVLDSSASSPRNTVAVALSANQSPRNVGEILFTDGFELLPLGMDWVDNSRHGRWRSAFRGYGKVGVALDIAHVLQES